MNMTANQSTNQFVEIRFNVEKNERKALVRVIEEILGCKAVFLFAPTMAYTIGDYHLDRKGTLSLVEGADVGTGDVRRLLDELSERGYTGEGAEEFFAPASSAPAPADDGIVDGSADAAAVVADAVVAGDGLTTTTETSFLDDIKTVVDEGLALTIEVPLTGFTDTALENLNRLVVGKSLLIMKAIGAVALPIERYEDTLRFPWFVVGSSDTEVDAYVRFIYRLCELAKKQKRVMMTEKPIDLDSSEKYAFRCFLLRLEFKGKEYASARDVLLSRLSGNGSFKTGDQNDRGKRKQRGTKTVGDNAEQIIAPATSLENGSGVESGESSTPSPIPDLDSTLISTDISDSLCSDTPCTKTPLKCNECKHHAYSGEGQLYTSDGDAVNISNRTLDKYTHYCINTPRGFRKLKHAVDWSGSHNAPSWCPLYAEARSAGDDGVATPDMSIVVAVGDVVTGLDVTAKEVVA